MPRKITRETLREGPQCSHCDSTGWVCETHSDRPWDGAKACGCGGAGMPCPSCNLSSPDDALDFRRAFNEMRVSTTTRAAEMMVMKMHYTA